MPHFSVICVYNDAEELKKWLLNSLDKQRQENYERILVDNRQSRFSSAAAALNHGAKRATGKYYLFVHQDVSLLSGRWFEDAYEHLESIGDLGLAGVAGMSAVGSDRSDRGRNVIFHAKHRGEWPMGNEINRPEPVQTVDELLLIIPAKVFDKYQFNEELCGGWHLYGVEYSLRMRERASKGVYVLPMPVHHGSGTDSRGWEAEYIHTLKQVVGEYDAIDRVYTTVNDWPADPSKVHIQMRTEKIRRRLPSVLRIGRHTAKKILNKTPWFDFG